MATDTTNALTAEEWEERAFSEEADAEHSTVVDAQGDPSILTVTPLELLHEGDYAGSSGVGLGTRQRIDIERRHALAALCLHGQPFGFTQDDISLLWMLAKQHHPSCRCDYCSTLEPRAVNLMDRIAALLPPRRISGVPQDDNQ